MEWQPRDVQFIVPAAAGLTAVIALSVWITSYFRTPDLPDRPFGHEAASAHPTVRPTTRTGVSFYNQAVRINALPGSWSSFRGDRRDDISSEAVPLARSFPSGIPKTLWSIAAGEGYAGAAIKDGRVYLIDYDQAAQSDSMRCFSLADGVEVWRRSYPAIVKRNHGMSRTVPAVADGCVVSLGPKCNLLCADAITGDIKWQVDLVAEYGTVVPEWYAGQCPLIDRGKVIVTPGGSALVVAFDLKTGKPIWKTPNPNAWNMTHASVQPVDIEGVHMYVFCGSGGIAGVDAANGAILWDSTTWKIETATVPTPIDIGEGRVFFCGGYDAGSLMLHLTKSGNHFEMQTVFRTSPSVFGSDQQTPVFYKGYLYGVIPGGQLVCMDLTGKQVWSSGSEHRFGLGPYMIAGGMIYLMNDHGEVTIAEASSAGYKQILKALVLRDGTDSWGPMAIAGGRLIVRDLTRVICLDAAAH